MKRLIATILLAASTLAGYSQTNNIPNPPTNWISSPVLSFLSASNLLYGAFGIWDKDRDQYGGGIFLAYKLSPVVVPVFRLDYLDHRVWQPQAAIQLQAPFKIAGKWWTTPLIYGGLAVPMSGRGANDNEVVGIAGAGLAIGLPHSERWYVPRDVVYSVEVWSGGGYQNSTQFRFGLVWGIGER